MSCLWWIIHNVIRVSQLKPHHKDKEDESRYLPNHPQLEFKKPLKRAAEAILNHQVSRISPKTYDEYLVK